MADEPIPKASVLKKLGGGATPAPAVAAVQTATPTATPATSATPVTGGSLRRLGGAAPAVAAVAPVAAAPVIPATPVVAEKPVAGNRALAEQHLQVGLDHYDRQELEPAMQAYQACVAADPSFVLGYNNLGMVLIDLDRYDEAQQALYQAIRCDPNYSEAYNNLGFVLRRAQRNVEAVSAYQRFLELESDVDEGARIRQWSQTVLTENKLSEIPPFVLPEASKPAESVPAAAPAKLKKMAAWEAAAGNMETAAPVSVFGEIGSAPAAPSLAVRDALIASASAGLPPAGISALLPGQGNFGPKTVLRAAPSFDHPLVVNSSVAAAPTQSALTANALGVEAAEAVAIAAAASPSPIPSPAVASKAQEPDSIALIESGMDRFASDRLEESAALFQKVIERDPNLAEAYAGMGKVLVRMEKMQEGLEYLEKSIELDPDDPSPYYVKGFALRALERNIEAAEAYEIFLQLLPQAVDASKIKQWVTHIKGVSGDSAEALLENRAVLDANELYTDEDRHYKAAADEFQSGNVDHTFSACVAILNADPGHFRSRVLLGRAFSLQADLDSAIEQLEGALVTQPDYPEALYFLAQAADKKGDQKKSLSNYQRYLAVAPDGPRSQRIKEWMTAHPVSAPVAIVSANASDANQCELCLRVFNAAEITFYEGKATCANCLELMGVNTPSPESAQAQSAEEPLQSESTDVRPVVEALHPANLEPTVGRSKLKLALLGLLVAAGLGAGLYYSKVLTPSKPNPVMGQIPQPEPGPGALHQFDLANVKFQNEQESLTLAPYAAWNYKLRLEGLDGPEAKNIKVSYTLKDPPAGLLLNDNTLSWTPQFDNFSELRKGKQLKLEISASVKADDTANEPLTRSKTLTLTVQMNYEMSEPANLGLEEKERPTLSAGDLNGDKLADLIVCSGDLRGGKLRTYVQRGENPLPVPTSLASDGRYSAVYVGDMDGNGSDDLLATNWHTGQLKFFYQEEQSPRAGPSLMIGAGPVAIGVGRFDQGVGRLDKSKRVQIGVLLGLGGKLALTSIGEDHIFGPVQTIPIAGGGGPVGWVLPWNSAEAGAGFLVVTPLSAQPLQFVPYADGTWGPPLVSSLESIGLVNAVAVLRNDKGLPARLVLGFNESGSTGSTGGTGGETAQLLICSEKNGKFSVCSQSLPALSLSQENPLKDAKKDDGELVGLIAADINHDGWDEVLVLTRRGCQFYFANRAKSVSAGADSGSQEVLTAGPKFMVPATSRLLGPATLYRQSESGAELLLINESRKAIFLKPAVPMAEPVVPTEPVVPAAPVVPVAPAKPVAPENKSDKPAKTAGPTEKTSGKTGGK